MGEGIGYSLPGIAGKAALVTGGASGIGRAICTTLCSLGARVCVLDLSGDGEELARALRRAGGEALFVKADVTDPADVDACVGAAFERFGSLAILVNNAGSTTEVPFAELTVEKWKRIVEINLTGSYICSRAAVPFLAKAAGAAIVFVSSASSLTGSGGSIAYAAAKGGTNSMVRALARELAPLNIRVNGVAPRSIEGKLLTELYDEERIRKMIDATPVHRLGTGEDVARVVAFLASDLSSYITGETLLADGGRTFCG
jgi:3-oxoacyl-[acyl-carrier protein] reductase